MLTISRRPTGYKIGLASMITGLLLYIIGFATDSWTVFEVQYQKGSGLDENLTDPYFFESLYGHNGLWKTCDTLLFFTMEHCGEIKHSQGRPGWVPAVQGLQSVGVLGLVAALLYALVVNLIQQSPNINNRYLEITLIVSGVLGFIGSVVYAAASNGNDEVLLMAGSWHWYLDDSFETVVHQNDLSWSFAVNLAGCLLSLVSAVIMCAHNRLIHDQSSPISAPTAVAFSAEASGGSTAAGRGGGGGGNLVFLPPQHLASGAC